MYEREKKLRKYARQVRRLLPCSHKAKAAIMRQFRENVDGYLAENPNADFAQIKNQFGAPETIAAACVESTGTAEILKSLHSRKKIATAVAAVIAAVIAALLAWLVFLRWAAVEAEKSMYGTIEVVTGVVEDGDGSSAVEETDSISLAP